MRATPRPGCAIRRRAGSGPALRSAASPRKCRGRCCADGTRITASCSAIPGSASSAPGRRSTASRGWRVTTRSGITISRRKNACSFRPVNAVRRSAPISHRGCRRTHGRKSGCRRCFAIMRWSTSPRSCRKRLPCSARRRAAISPALRRGSSGCIPSTKQLGCWAAWKRAQRVSPKPSPGWPGGRMTTQNYRWKVLAQPCARPRGA